MTGYVFICEVCGTVLEDQGCRVTCGNCGRLLDGSDLPSLPADGALREQDGEVVFLPRPLPKASGNGGFAAAQHHGGPVAPSARTDN